MSCSIELVATCSTQYIEEIHANVNLRMYWQAIRFIYSGMSIIQTNVGGGVFG